LEQKLVQFTPAAMQLHEFFLHPVPSFTGEGDGKSPPADEEEDDEEEEAEEDAVAIAAVAVAVAVSSVGVPTFALCPLETGS
jgi:hypothetical protein